MCTADGCGLGAAKTARLSPPTQARSITAAWWELPLLQLPDLAWTEIVLAAVALPTTLVIAVAVGPQSSEHSSGRRVYVSEVVRAEVVEALATLTAATSSVLLWVLAAFVPRSPGGLAQALLLALAALYCACLAGLGGPSHRQRLRTLDELLRLREASSWVDTVRLPGRVRTFASYLVLVLIPAVAVTLLVLARLQALGALVEWWALAVVLGVATAAVSGLTWLSWLAWTAPRVSRPGCSSLDELRKPSPWRVLHVLVVLLCVMGAAPGLIWLSGLPHARPLDLALAGFISLAPLLGLWLFRRRRVSTPALQQAALRERRRLMRQAESARLRAGTVEVAPPYVRPRCGEHRCDGCDDRPEDLSGHHLRQDQADGREGDEKCQSQ